jgi:hypothetical protein
MKHGVPFSNLWFKIVCILIYCCLRNNRTHLLLIGTIFQILYWMMHCFAFLMETRSITKVLFCNFLLQVHRSWKHKLSCFISNIKKYQDWLYIDMLLSIFVSLKLWIEDNKIAIFAFIIKHVCGKYLKCL